MVKQRRLWEEGARGNMTKRWGRKDLGFPPNSPRSLDVVHVSEGHPGHDCGGSREKQSNQPQDEGHLQQQVHSRKAPLLGRSPHPEIPTVPSAPTQFDYRRQKHANTLAKNECGWHSHRPRRVECGRSVCVSHKPHGATALPVLALRMQPLLKPQRSHCCNSKSVVSPLQWASAGSS